jgi:hypothetical protein
LALAQEKGHMECKTESKTLRARLEAYGLADREQHGVDITVEANQELVLSSRDPQATEQIVHLRPKSAHDLKRWIGVPEHAVRTSPSRPAAATRSEYAQADRSSLFVPQVRFGCDDRDSQAYLSAFLFRGVSTVTKGELDVLERYIERAAIGVSVFLANDIYVAAGARLVVDRKIQVLFARYITVADKGRLEMNSPVARIDCAGMKRQSPFSHTTTTAVHAASVVQP